MDNGIEIEFNENNFDKNGLNVYSCKYADYFCCILIIFFYTIVNNKEIEKIMNLFQFFVYIL